MKILRLADEQAASSDAMSGQSCRPDTSLRASEVSSDGAQRHPIATATLTGSAALHPGYGPTPPRPCFAAPSTRRPPCGFGRKVRWPRRACRRRSAPDRTSGCRGCAARELRMIGIAARRSRRQPLHRAAHTSPAPGRARSRPRAARPTACAAPSVTRCSSSATNGLGAREQRHQFAATRRRRRAPASCRSVPPCPLLHRGAGDREHVVAGFLRHRPGAVEPFLHAARAGIVGRRRKAEIAELLAQLAEELRRFRQRLHRIERIEQPPFAGGARHELRDALRALAAARHRADRSG